MWSAGTGVLAGHAGDLKLGLPWQSVAVGDTLVHEPMRLLVVIHAPIDRIDTIVRRHRVVADLVDGEWFSFAARAEPTGPWQLRTRTGWQTFDAATEPTHPTRRNPE